MKFGEPRIDPVKEITFKDGAEEKLAVVAFWVCGLGDQQDATFAAQHYVQIFLPVQGRTDDQLRLAARQELKRRIRHLFLRYASEASLESAWIPPK